MSPTWEAVLLFIFYFVLRWVSSLRSLGIVLLGTSLVLITKAALVELGKDFYRIVVWYKLLKNGEFVLHTVHMERFYIDLIAYFFIVTVLFFPLYLIYGIVFMILGLVAGESEGAPDSHLTSKLWRKLGWVGYEYGRFLAPLLRIRPDELVYTSVRWPAKKWRYHCSVLLSILMTVTLLIISLAICIFSLFPILTFLLAGKHIAVFVVVIIEIFVTVYDIDLAHGFYERMLQSSFIIPIFLWLYLKISTRIGEETLQVMQMDNRCSKRERLMAKFYSKIPTSVEAAAIAKPANGRMLSFSELDDVHLHVQFIEEVEIVIKILDGNNHSNIENV